MLRNLVFVVATVVASNALAEGVVCRCSFDTYDFSDVGHPDGRWFISPPNKEPEGRRESPYKHEPMGTEVVRNFRKLEARVGKLLFMFPPKLEFGALTFNKKFRLGGDAKSFDLTYGTNF